MQLLDGYSKHCIATKALMDVRLRAESEHRTAGVSRRVLAPAAQLRLEQIDEIVQRYSELKSVKGHAGASVFITRRFVSPYDGNIEDPETIAGAIEELITEGYDARVER